MIKLSNNKLPFSSRLSTYIQRIAIIEPINSHNKNNLANNTMEQQYKDNERQIYIYNLWVFLFLFFSFGFCVPELIRFAIRNVDYLNAYFQDHFTPKLLLALIIIILFCWLLKKLSECLVLCMGLPPLTFIIQHKSNIAWNLF